MNAHRPNFEWRVSNFRLDRIAHQRPRVLRPLPATAPVVATYVPAAAPEGGKIVFIYFPDKNKTFCILSNLKIYISILLYFIVNIFFFCEEINIPNDDIPEFYAPHIHNYIAYT